VSVSQRDLSAALAKLGGTEDVAQKALQTIVFQACFSDVQAKTSGLLVDFINHPLGSSSSARLTFFNQAIEMVLSLMGKLGDAKRDCPVCDDIDELALAANVYLKNTLLLVLLPLIFQCLMSEITPALPLIPAMYENVIVTRPKEEISDMFTQARRQCLC
jgi:hypothetical protein